MESQNHMNDQIIINQPRIPIKKDGKNVEIIEESIDNDDSEIVYLNLNEEYIDDEYGVSLNTISSKIRLFYSRSLFSRFVSKWNPI